MVRITLFKLASKGERTGKQGGFRQASKGGRAGNGGQASKGGQAGKGNFC